MHAIFILLLCHGSCHDKITSKEVLLYNSQVNFVVHSGMSYPINDSVLGVHSDYVGMDIDSSLYSKVKHLSYSNSIKLLRNQTTDWATNLLLYAVYKRDAKSLDTEERRDEWLKCGKKTDIKYWRKFLSRKIHKKDL